MADELPEGHIQMSDKWSNMGAPEGTTTTRRGSRGTTTPVVEPAEEVVEETAEEEAEEDTSDEESTESADEEATEEEE